MTPITCLPLYLQNHFGTLLKSQKPTDSPAPPRSLQHLPYLVLLKINKKTGGLAEQQTNIASFSTPLFSCQILVWTTSMIWSKVWKFGKGGDENGKAVLYNQRVC